MSMLGRILRCYINQGFGIHPDKKKGSRTLTVLKDSSLEEKDCTNPRQGFLSLKAQTPGRNVLYEGGMEA